MEIKQILSLAHHCLHLCTSSKREETVFSCVGEADVFVTSDCDFWKKRFEERKISCRIKRPGVVKPNESIVVDGSSLNLDWQLWEEKWKKQAQVVCIYNVDTLDPHLVKNLVDIHSKMILSVDKLRMISDKTLEKELEHLDPELVEELVKRELKTVILSLLLSQPLCGADLVKLLYQKFRVFVSPGQLYPTLHELEKSGLLYYEYKFKNKIYSIKEKKDAEAFLTQRIRINSLLSNSLMGD